MRNVLVAVDETAIRVLISRSISACQGIHVEEANSLDECLDSIRRTNPRIVFLDLHVQRMSSKELLRRIRAVDSRVPIIFVSRDCSSRRIIETMRDGAFDYISNPIDARKLQQLCLSALDSRDAMDRPVALSIRQGQTDETEFVGTSKHMVEVFKQIGRVAAESIPVLITGESGSGKEMVARALHSNGSRINSPFVAINCAAIPKDLLESELFGHEKGAFTNADQQRIGRFEQCCGGTILLDEIGDMSVDLQSKILRLLQNQEFERVGGNTLVKTDVRVVAATNKPLEDMVRKGEFRQDLLFRLNGFEIHLAPLRERREDIPILLAFFLLRAANEMARKQLEGISPEALEALVNYSWPGNVRELQSVVRQSIINCPGTVIDLAMLPDYVVRQQDGTPAAAERPREMVSQLEDLSTGIESKLGKEVSDLYAYAHEEFDAILISRVLEYVEGNISTASKILGLSRNTVRKRARTLGFQSNSIQAINHFAQAGSSAGS